MDAESIADAIVSTIKQWGLDMSCLVGQGYDGAAVMSSSKNGVQAKIAAQYPSAITFIGVPMFLTLRYRVDVQPLRRSITFLTMLIS